MNTRLTRSKIAVRASESALVRLVLQAAGQGSGGIRGAADQIAAAAAKVAGKRDAFRTVRKVARANRRQ